MVGVLEGKHWLNVVRHRKGRLLMKIDGYTELEVLLYLEGIAIKI